MCYHISHKKDQNTIKDDFGLDISLEIIPQYYHLNGYERGEVLVITQEEPNLIQKVTWSIAPPYSSNSDAYWKKVGGGALNTRVESFFEERTPYWKIQAIQDNKCIIILDGLFKVYTASNGNKIPMYIRKPDDSLFGVYGYYTDQGETLTCSILTTDADEFFNEFHTRMPFTINPEDVDYYFQLNSLENLKQEVLDFRSIHLDNYTVSKDVINSRVHSNRSDIIKKVDYDELNTLF